MMTPYHFQQSDFNNLEIVRQLVFQRLKTDSSWNQFDYWDMNVDQLVRFDNSRLKDRFLILAQEIMWQLINQNVLTPGINASNLNLPWFRITDYGRKVLEENRFIPHDPTEYLTRTRAYAKNTVVQPTFTYLAEALRCFNGGCHTASVLLLGVAAEAVILQCFDRMAATLQNTKEVEKCKKMTFIKEKHKWIMDKFFSVDRALRRNTLSEHTEITLNSMYTLIRQQRNELGHPQATPPDITREAAYVYFQLFPLIIQSVEELAEFARQHQL